VSAISAKEFGKVFIAPLVLKILENLPSKNQGLYFLAREGYWLSKAHSCYSGMESSNYLLTSRAFLFRLTIDNCESYQYSLKGDYEGSLKELLRIRFLISDSDLDNCFSKKVLSKNYLLPYDYEDLCKVLDTHQAKLAELIAPSKEAYLSYLGSMGVSDCDELHVVDIGYSGTIQALLTLLLNKETFGHYLIASKPGEHLVNTNKATMRGYLNSGVKLGDGYLPLDRSMFMEALLTSPQGQFLDIRFSEHPDKKFDFYFGRKINSQKYFYEVEQVMEGALSYVEFAAQNNIQFSGEEVEALISQIVSKPNMIPKSLWHLFTIDDDVTGNCTVDALDMFGLKS